LTTAESLYQKKNNKNNTKRSHDKQSRRKDRKNNNNKGKSLDDMIVHVDVNGNFTSVPPHLQNRDEDLAAAKKSRSTVDAEDTVCSGTVTYTNEKGYRSEERRVGKE